MRNSRILEIIHKTQIDDVLNKTERKGSKLDERQTGRLARINSMGAMKNFGMGI